MSLTALAEFAATLDVRALPPDVLGTAKACLLYGGAVGIAGTGLGLPDRVARALDQEAPGEGPATRFLDGRRTGTGNAAFANAVLFHSRIQEDAHPAGHIGVVVLPAAIARAEAEAAPGGDLVAAVVAGYEVALRIGRDHATALSARGFRTTPAYGVFGAAAAGARLAGLDGARTAHALALAAGLASGLREFVRAGTDDYAVQAGVAAREGLLAAALAAQGCTGPPSALDGEAGFFRAFGGDAAEPGRRLTEGLGRAFELVRVSYKPYPVCQFHRGIVRGALELRRAAERVPLRALTIRLHPFEADFVGVRHAGPFWSFPQTFMSAPFCAALAWARGTVSLAGLHAFEASDVLALVGRVEVVADAERARYRPRLMAWLQDGRRLEWEEAEGDGAYRLTWDAAVRMARVLGEEVGVPPALTGRLVEAVERLDGAPGVGPLVEAISAAARAARVGPLTPAVR